MTAYYENCYATSGKTYETNTDSIVLYRRNFEVTKTLKNCTHSYTSKVTTAPTCGKNGVRTYTCSVCGDKYKETIPATGLPGIYAPESSGQLIAESVLNNLQEGIL